MDKLRSMETFIAVVESGSFTGAAARLEMSAVMVGKYVALLESQLGTRLLERNTRRQSLTDHFIASGLGARRRCPACKGASRTMSTTRRRSFRRTSAALTRRFAS